MNRDDWYALLLIVGIVIIGVFLATYSTGIWNDVIGDHVTPFIHGRMPEIPIIPGG